MAAGVSVLRVWLCVHFEWEIVRDREWMGDSCAERSSVPYGV